MSSKDAHLYRPAAPPKPKSTASNPHDTTFSSAFSSLLASSATAPAKPRTSVRKNDIFSTSNRGAKKRAAADMLASSAATTAAGKPTSSERLDDAEWRRAKRKMDEKARLYAALKRGDVEDRDERYGVDFDRKWAEKDDKDEASEQSDGDDGSDSGDEQVEYVDDMGRTRTGSRKEVQAEQRRLKRQARAHEAEAEDSGRPVAPRGVIYGDTLQAQAFDLESSDLWSKMADLAKKRDKEETPPPDEHYDASKEVRTKGTGFYQFSQDKETREEQMRSLEEMRKETERVRGEKVSEREVERERRRKEIEERRKVIREKKGKVMAERFLDGLGEEMTAGSTRDESQTAGNE